MNLNSKTGNAGRAVSQGRAFSLFSKLLAPAALLVVLLGGHLYGLPPSSCLAAAGESAELLPFSRSITLIGFTGPRQQLTLRSEVAGRCSEVLIDVGDTVAADGLVARLDTTFIQLEREKNRISQEEAERQLDLEKKNLKRYTTLVKENSTALATYEDAALRAEILTLRQQSLRKEAQRLEELLRRHNIVGPAGWLVLDRQVEPGEYLGAGMEVVRLGDFRRMVLVLLVSIEELELLQMHQAKAGADGFPVRLPELGRTCRATLHQVTPQVDDRSRKVRVELLLEEISSELQNSKDRKPQWGVLGGLRGELDLQGKLEPGLFTISRSALLERYDSYWLMTLEGEYRRIALQRFVESDGSGGRAGENLAVVSGEGLAAGQHYRRNPGAEGAQAVQEIGPQTSQQGQSD